MVGRSVEQEVMKCRKTYKNVNTYDAPLFLLQCVAVKVEDEPGHSLLFLPFYLIPFCRKGNVVMMHLFFKLKKTKYLNCCVKLNKVPMQ